MQFLLRSSCGISFICLSHISQSHRLFMQKLQKGVGIQACSRRFLFFYSSLFISGIIGIQAACFGSLSLCVSISIFSLMLVLLRAYMLRFLCYHFLGRSFNRLACLISSLSFRILYVSRGLEMGRFYRLIIIRSMSCVKP